MDCCVDQSWSYLLFVVVLFKNPEVIFIQIKRALCTTQRGGHRAALGEHGHFAARSWGCGPGGCRLGGGGGEMAQQALPKHRPSRTNRRNRG